MKGGTRKTPEQQNNERRATKNRRKATTTASRPWQKALQSQLAHDKQVAEIVKEKRRKRQVDQENTAKILKQGSVVVLNPTERDIEDWNRIVEKDHRLNTLLTANTLIINRESCCNYATERGFTWKNEANHMFGGYFTNKDGDCLLVDCE